LQERGIERLKGLRAVTVALVDRRREGAQGLLVARERGFRGGPLSVEE
jgi:hypothetical protein